MQFPSVATVAAFGGTTATATALGLPKSTIHRWKIAKRGLIPRWWTDRIKAVAEQSGINLPRPRKVAK